MKSRICRVVAALAVLSLPLSACAKQHEHKGAARTATQLAARDGMHSGMMNMDHSGMMSGVVERSMMEVFFLPAVIDRLDPTDAQNARMTALADDVTSLMAQGPGALATLGDEPSTEAVRGYYVRQADLRAGIFDTARKMLNVLTPAQQVRYSALEMKELHEAVMGSSRHMTMMELMNQLRGGSMSMESMPMMQSESDSTKKGMHGSMSHEKQDPR